MKRKERERRLKAHEMDVFDDRNQILDALADMVNQFAYRIEKPNGQAVLNSGGLSALESAFDVLGLPDPCLLDDYWDKIDDRRGETWSDLKQRLPHTAAQEAAKFRDRF